MGWKGTLRSVNASINRMEREQQRARRERERRRREVEKFEALEREAHEVEEFEYYVESIQSFHQAHVEEIDWFALAQKKGPHEPVLGNTCEMKAQQKLDKFRPSIVHKMLRSEQTVREKLKTAVALAIVKDEDHYQRVKNEFELEMVNYEEEVGLARRVIAGEPDACVEVITKFERLSNIDNLGNKLVFSFSKDGDISVVLSVSADEIIPDRKLTLLQSGKKSEKKMPRGEHNEIFQDYVCSAVIRVAREIFGLLPVDKITITATDRLLNSATGHTEEQPILSVLIPRETLGSMNLEWIDPSDSMSNFSHNIDFRKTKGFAPVDTLRTPEVEASYSISLFSVD